MKPCYFTGKVWIGSNYFPDARPPIYGDMALVQRALLEKRPKPNWILAAIWRWL